VVSADHLPNCFMDALELGPSLSLSCLGHPTYKSAYSACYARCADAVLGRQSDTVYQHRRYEQHLLAGMGATSGRFAERFIQSLPNVLKLRTFPNSLSRG
jgi:hypothetical protein